MRAVLISTYDMGRQPLGLASPAAWLRQAGVEVVCADVSRRPLRAEALANANVVGLFLPMHTATRLALELLPQLRAAAPQARFCGFGIYAELYRAQLLRAERLDAVFGAEYEAALTAYVTSGHIVANASLPRLPAVVPDRSGLPPLSRYARLQLGDGSSRATGYTEASRGCKHLCRHCPIVPVYGGRFRVTPVETVLADIRQQVAAGAEHITFGDPDFFNGPTHARRVMQALHREFPALSYDVTIKVEHLRRHADLLPELGRTGCALITTAVESFDDAVLTRLDKGHTRADFEAVLETTRGLGLGLNPTFVAFTPWTMQKSFAAMISTIAELDLIEQVQPVQYGIRLLLPPGSRLLEQQDAALWLGEYNDEALSFGWRAPEPAADELCARVQTEVAAAGQARRSRRETFAAIAKLAGVRVPPPAAPRATIPWLDEPWFC